MRWRHPTEGLLMPDRFIPAAERSTLNEPLTRWVLGEALRQQRAWSDAGLELTMAVNVSARSLTRGSDLPDTVAKLTETLGITPGKLILELTENALIDADAPEILNLLHAMGERLAIDDFGTGHSSLVYLQRLPVDEVKLDRSFVMQPRRRHRRRGDRALHDRPRPQPRADGRRRGRRGRDRAEHAASSTAATPPRATSSAARARRRNSPHGWPRRRLSRRRESAANQ